MFLSLEISIDNSNHNNRQSQEPVPDYGSWQSLICLRSDVYVKDPSLLFSNCKGIVCTLSKSPMVLGLKSTLIYHFIFSNFIAYLVFM